MTITAIEKGYRMFADWENARPNNFFSYDPNLQRTLEFYDGATAYRAYVPRLYKCSKDNLKKPATMRPTLL